MAHFMLLCESNTLPRGTRGESNRMAKAKSSREGSVKLAEFIKLRRETAKPPLTQKDLALKLQAEGFSYAESSIAHWESTKNPIVPPLQVEEFAKALAKILQTEPGHLYAAAGWLGGLDKPISPAHERIGKLVEQLSPERQQFVMETVETMVKQQKVHKLQ